MRKSINRRSSTVSRRRMAVIFRKGLCGISGRLAASRVLLLFIYIFLVCFFFCAHFPSHLASGSRWNCFNLYKTMGVLNGSSSGVSCVGMDVNEGRTLLSRANVRY